jgi:hypothetical protein
LDKGNDSPRLEYKQRWVNQYNFYVNEPHWSACSSACVPTFPSPHECV